MCRICAEIVGEFFTFLSGLNDAASYRTVPGAEDLRTPPPARRNRGVDQSLTPQIAASRVRPLTSGPLGGPERFHRERIRSRRARRACYPVTFPPLVKG